LLLLSLFVLYVSTAITVLYIVAATIVYSAVLLSLLMLCVIGFSACTTVVACAVAVWHITAAII